MGQLSGIKRCLLDVETEPSSDFPSLFQTTSITSFVHRAYRRQSCLDVLGTLAIIIMESYAVVLHLTETACAYMFKVINQYT